MDIRNESIYKIYHTMGYSSRHTVMNQQSITSPFNLPYRLALAGCIWALALLAGCATPEERALNRIQNTPAYRPTNVYAVPSLPEEIRRVVILPVYAPNENQQVVRMVQEQASRALTSTNRFETIAVSEDVMVALFGVETLNTVQQLPSNLFDELETRYGADAILFTALSQYDPYQPITLGLRMNLISAHTGTSLWAFDDVFNAGDARVTSGAMKHGDLQGTMPYPMKNPQIILASPSKFTNYAFSTAFTTLPTRGATLENITVTRDYAVRPTETPNPQDKPASRQPSIPDLNQ